MSNLFDSGSHTEVGWAQGGRDRVSVHEQNVIECSSKSCFWKTLVSNTFHKSRKVWNGDNKVFFLDEDKWFINVKKVYTIIIWCSVNFKQLCLAKGEFYRFLYIV